MAVTNKSLGAKITASIARRGFAPNIYNGVIVGTPQIVTQPNGRMNVVAEVILAQTSLQTGERYLSAKTHNLAFAYDRAERDEMLDGSADAPKSWQDLVREQGAASLAFQMSKPVFDGQATTGATLSLDDIEAEAAAETAEVA
jgi:hypothetical protein